MTVSLEIVPRDREALAAGAREAAEFPAITVFNVPDLLRFPLRSWEACGILKENSGPGMAPRVLIPHLRAIDFDPAKPFPHRDFLLSRGINRVLVITGDPPPPPDPRQGSPRRTWPVEAPAFISRLKAEMPELAIYAAFDPYRTNISRELEYLKVKEEAGAAGFMSQPFFDLRLLEIYAEYLEGKDVYWGLSPVLSGSSRNYWESRNRAVFPKSFRPALDWNVDFGRRVLDFCEKWNFNVYLMPIKVDIRSYLGGLLGG